MNKKRKILMCIAYVGLGIVIVYLLLCIFRVPLPCGLSNRSNALSDFILAITALVAIVVYRDGKEMDEVNVMIKLRELLTTDMNHKIHKSLYNKHTKYEDSNDDERDTTLDDSAKSDDYVNHIHDCDMYQYLGCLELSYILLEKGVLSEENFKNQFAYRLEYVVNNVDVVRLIAKNEQGWKNLMELIQEFYPHDYIKTKLKLNK